MTITIKTHLDSGIYKASGGGETVTHYEFKSGPVNLVKAIGVLFGHRCRMVRSYGNIGCGRSWLEIDGQQIHDYDLQGVFEDDMAKYGKVNMALVKSGVQKARELLAEVAAGYDTNKYDLSVAEFDELYSYD